MKFSEQWLRQWVNPPIETKALCDQLTLAGLEVDKIEPVAGDFSNVIVGEVISTEQHPNADRLKICQVNVGDEALTIVCGGKNVRPGLKVAVAQIGAVLPGDFKIKKSKIRDVVSYGMLCSSEELGLPKDIDGIIELPPEAPIAADLRDYLQLDDLCIDIDLTPNRGDCLSIIGIAREVAALNNSPLLKEISAHVPPTTKKTLPVSITAANGCNRYVGRIISSIPKDATTPIWMQERLRRSGVRAISPIVDVTNYIMIEMGQPMHAFDLNKIKGGIEVRFAREGESLTLLDGKNISLNETSLLICDHEKPLALAGIMGGANSEVSESTTDILLESAYFEPLTIRATGRDFGLSTDGSYRWERGVDYTMQMTAIEYATELITHIVGGSPGPVFEVTQGEFPKRDPISLRRDRIPRILGIHIADEDVERYLHALGMSVTKTEEGWTTVAPSYRYDLQAEHDLIEELARMYGYNHIPTTRTLVPMTPQVDSVKVTHTNRVRECLIDRGYHEAITYSFVSPEIEQVFTPDYEPYHLLNPISSEMSVMRTTLWPGLLQAYQHNADRQQDRVRLFEIGMCFYDKVELIQEHWVGGLLAGSLQPEQWGLKSRPVDFFDIKSDVENLISLTRQSSAFEFISAEHPALHPGQCARIDSQGKSVGWVGQLHPALAQKFDLRQNIYLFTLKLSSIINTLLPQYQQVSKFPSVRRDIAVVVDTGVQAQELVGVIKGSAGEWLDAIRIFDVYSGEAIGVGKKSVALAITLLHPERTLTDQEVNDVMDHVVLQLKSTFNVTLRA
ncbi:MAG: phenylalanine--tRNA ligase subunit beta [Gammaproteobacteria bacterium]|nr:phenylalanine--tRNA ligase subunit beta [Gammaproteobacteria bacterium]